MAKTATTAFQAFAWANREQLAEAGLTYCSGFLRRNHAELAVAFSSKVTPLTRSQGAASAVDRLAVRERLPEMLGDPPGAPAYLATSEHLSTLVREQDDIDDLAEMLRSLYDEVTVLIVVRRADYWTPSAYVEAVKSRERRPFDEDFIARRSFVLDHQAMFQRWGKAFGDDNVHAVAFLESDKHDAKRLPARLLHAAGLAPGTVDAWPMPPLVANTSLSAYATELLRQLSNGRRKDPPMRVIANRGRVVATLRERWPGPAPALTPEAADELRRRGWVRTGIDQSPYAADDGWAEWASQPDAPTAPLVAVARKDVRQLTRLLQDQRLIDSTWFWRNERRAMRRARRLARTFIRR